MCVASARSARPGPSAGPAGGLAKAIAGRDKANANIEAATAKITTNTANKNALEDEIDKLNGLMTTFRGM